MAFFDVQLIYHIILHHICNTQIYEYSVHIYFLVYGDWGIYDMIYVYIVYSIYYTYMYVVYMYVKST